MSQNARKPSKSTSARTLLAGAALSAGMLLSFPAQGGPRHRTHAPRPATSAPAARTAAPAPSPTGVSAVTSTNAATRVSSSPCERSLRPRVGNSKRPMYGDGASCSIDAARVAAAKPGSRR